MAGASASSGLTVPLQEAMWVTDRPAGTPSRTQHGIAVRVQRPVPGAVLQVTLDAVSARHEMLRSLCRLDYDLELQQTCNSAGPRLSFEEKPVVVGGSGSG